MSTDSKMGVRLGHQMRSAYKDPRRTSQILEDMSWLSRRKNVESRATGKGQREAGVSHRDTQGSTVHTLPTQGPTIPQQPAIL